MTDMSINEAEIADWAPDTDMTGVSISDEDRLAGSPKPGDKIARNPKNHEDRWLIAAEFFAENFAAAPQQQAEPVAEIDRWTGKA